MAEIMKKELDVKDFEMTSIDTVEDTCFVNISENEIKMKNIEVKEENLVYEFDPLQSEPKRIRKSKHRYSCSRCEYFASTTWRLKIHEEIKHIGVRYPCLECEHAATTASDLTRHVRNKHKGVRYACSQCNYAATTSGTLKKHLENKHEGVRYPCLQCEYAATTAAALKKTC
ncbi:transcriptional repressor CTCFL [Eurytemora carolleeae]|uniref:transcriptional repressor CTCFL n=1 Tax=Eurytemora carolleeae TaxID=1294199 RepID=UPI000C790533|nr:transcriptional repressor CTCFL [Eurytemora carolleeae]|eukprot:XP_023341393.1 transcriptional repressor CTCFL-like [Eurytemora affinis]